MTPSSRPPTPRRVRITSPRRQAARRSPRRPPAAEINEQTALGEVYVDALLSAQLRLAALVLGSTLLVVAAMLTIVLLIPAASGPRIGPVPWTWLALGGVSYVVLTVTAYAYLRATERLEREFATMVRAE